MERLVEFIKRMMAMLPSEIDKPEDKQKRTRINRREFDLRGYMNHIAWKIIFFLSFLMAATSPNILDAVGRKYSYIATTCFVLGSITFLVLGFLLFKAKDQVQK
jgi:hypothetical protein